jgi:hypothetical protein
MLVRRVLMIELVLHQARELPKFGHVLPKQPHFVHPPQNRRHIPALIENFQERLAHMLVMEELAIHERKILPNRLCQVRVQLQAALLRVQEHPHQPPRLILEDSRRRGADLPVYKSEAINNPFLRLPKPAANEPANRREHLRFRQPRQPLFQ